MKAAANTRRAAAKPPLLLQRKAFGSSRPHDSHERQADDRGQAFARGGRGLARGLSPAAPAGFVDPASIGQPLPLRLKADLEAAFDAELGAVRIHRDAAAHSATRRFGARAFASGTAIYFGDRQFDPDTHEGRSLIGHELAHVLQQTGRASFGRSVAARPMLGSGMVQCDPLTPAEIEAIQQKAFEDMVAIHRGGLVPTGDLELEAAIDRVGELTGRKLVNDLSKPAFSEALNKKAEAGEFTKIKSARARSFLFDCLKVLGWFPAAAKFVAADDAFVLRTFYPLAGFMDFLRTDKAYGRPWLAAFLSHDLFKTTWPDMVLKGWRAFYFRPTFVPARDKSLVDRLTAVFAKLEDKTVQSPPTLRTDAYWLVWDLIGDLDDERIQAQYALRRKLLDLAPGSTSIFEVFVGQLPSWREEALAKGGDNAVPAFERTLAAGLVPLIDEASIFWKKALADYSAWKGAWTLGDDVLTDTAAALPVAKFAGVAAEPLHASFLAAVTTLFETRTAGDGTILLPGPTEYRQKLDAFVAALTATNLKAKKGETPLPWIDSLQAIAMTEATAKTPDPARLSEIAILPLVFEAVLGYTANYDAKADQDAPHFDDQRHAHRLRLARWIATAARWLGWNDLLQPLAPVFNADEGVDPYLTGMARLMLVSDWEPDAVRPIVDMLTDFPEKADKPVLEDAPFSLRVLVEWFRYDYHSRLRDALQTLLLAETRLTKTTRLDLEPLLHLRQTRSEIRAAMAATAEAEYAIKTAAAFPLKIPQRFRVADSELVVPKDASVDYFDLIYDHPKTQMQLVRRAPGIILPNKPGAGVFAWLLPPLDGLIAFMLRIPSIAHIVARQTDETEAAWYQRLAPQGEEPAVPGEQHISPEDIVQLNKALLKWLEKFGEKAEADIPDLWRRMIILRRRSLALRLGPQIDIFADHPYVSHAYFGEETEAAIFRLGTPQRVIDAMRGFEGVARPLRERSADAGAEADLAEREAAQVSADAQMALLTFSLAPSLLELKPNTIKWDLKQHLYEYFQLAIDFAADEKKLKALRHGLGTEDEAAAQVIPEARRTELVTRMKAFMTAFEEEVAKSQSERGFRSDDGKSILPNTEKFQSEILPGKPGENEWHTNQDLTPEGRLDEDTGDKWRLVKVHLKFKYHPGAGAGAAPGMRKGTGGPVAPARLVIPEGSYAGEYFAPNFPADLILFTYSLNDTEHQVKATDLYHLDSLADIFLWRAIQLSFQASATIIMTFADWMMTVAAVFFPAAAIAEFVANMALMLESGEFDDTIAMLSDDPIEFAKHALERLTNDLFDPTNIWKFVLLGSQHSPLFALQQHQPKKRKAKPTGKLGKVVAVLRSLGARFEGAMHRVHDYTQPPFRRAQGKIAMRPTLAWLLKRASRLVTTIYELIPPEEIKAAKDKEGPGYLSEFREIVKGENIEQEFRDRVVELFEGIRQIELPGELIDVAPAIELILGFILSKFGSRGKILRILLSTMPVPTEWTAAGGKPGYTNALAFISMAIRDHFIKGSEADPNSYWKRDVLPVVGVKFNEIRGDLVEGLYEAADGVLKALDLAPLKRPGPDELPKAEVVPQSLGFESEASLPGGARPKIGRPRMSPAGGAPLPRASRGRFERALGADLSHVRIHANAGAATRPIGANALTSGSHVFLRPGIAATAPSGQRLLAHELTHVVQQTGPLGLGRAGSRTPTLGRPNIGVRHEPSRERAADQVASHFAGGQAVPASVRSSIGRFQGIQPNIDPQLATSILSELSKADAKSFTKDLEGGKDPEGWAEAKALWGQIRTILQKSNAKLGFAKFLQDTVGGDKIAELVIKHLNARITEIGVSKFEIEIKKVAQLAQQPRRKTKDTDPDTELDPKGFVQMVANYLFATTDVALKIDVDPLVKTVKHIELFSLDIAEVGGTSALWKRVMEKSFAGGAVTDMEKAQREMRERIRDLGPQPNVWDSSAYKFKQSVIDDYVQLLQTRALGNVDEVPPVHEYRLKDSPKGHGLAIATHGELTKASRSIGTYQRESHHTTQYLLIEFFSNDKDASQKAFPGPAAEIQADFAPAGIKIDGAGIVQEIGGIGSPLQVAALNPNSNRGANMPAILISARCHQRGELHILRSARWNSASNETKGTSTQGFAIENEFNKSIPSADADLRPRDAHETPERRDRLNKAIAADPIKAKTTYYKAALATYSWMHNHMLPALSEGLLSEEYAYYRGIAARKHMGTDGKMAAAYDLKPGDLVDVHSDAKTNNDQVMAQYNWKAG